MITCNPRVVLRGNPGSGPLVVIPGCFGMIIFAGLTIKRKLGVHTGG
jgi:hypothetical protein